MPKIAQVVFERKRTYSSYLPLSSSLVNGGYHHHHHHHHIHIHRIAYEHEFNHQNLNHRIRNLPLSLINSYPLRHAGSLARSIISHSRLSFDKMPQRQRVGQICRESSSLRMRPLIAHCFAIKTASLAHLPTATSLLVLYSRSGDFGSSMDLFDEICGRDIIMWNAIMTVSIENRFYGLAMHFFVKLMGDGSCGFDSTSLLLALSALSRTQMKNNVQQGRAIHSLSLKSGILVLSSLCNVMIDMYAKCSDLGSAESVFAEMECRDIVSWNSVMSGCLHNNHPHKTLWYFREMNYSGEEADAVNLSCAIAASASLGDSFSGEMIYAWGFKLGYDASLHTSVANSLISFYSQCGDIEAAETLFRGIIHKDVVSWNAMIDGFASNGMILEPFYLLTEMQLAESVQPDLVTIVSVTPLCAELMLLREGKTIHAYITRRQMGSDLSVANSLIDMYLKCKSVRNAKLLFNNVNNKDLISWNTMISGYAQNGQSKEAQELFKKLLFRCSNCSSCTLLAILPSCASPEGLQFGKSIHCWQLKVGFLNNILAVNAVMRMYIHCGDLVAAFSLLRTISLTADVSSWNTVIVGCTQNCHFKEALETFNLMRREGSVRHDSITLVNVISACGNCEFVSEGKCLHALALKTLAGSDIRVQNALITMYGRCGDIKRATSVFCSSLNHNLCSWNCMISAFSQNKDGGKALELFRCLELEPNEITIVAILSACTQLGVLRHGKQIHGYVFRAEFQKNSFIAAALLGMYCNCGRLDIAVCVFNNLQEKTIVAWNSMISAYGFHGQGGKAIAIFHEMLESGVGVTEGTFVSLLSACSHSGLVNEGIYYYTRMLEHYGIESVTEHYVCVVDMLGRSGRLFEAVDFISQMQTPPKPGVLGALLSACKYHGDVEMGREVADLLFKLEPQNVGYYISLSNMYIAVGSWKEAVELRDMVKDKQSKKPIGYSRIEDGLS